MWQSTPTPDAEVTMMSKGAKNNDGNKYNDNPNYAEQVIANNVKQAAQNNPKEDARK
jgi:hypothetical protein